MNPPDQDKPRDPQLRTKVEVQIAHAPTTGAAARPAEELLHELQVHQVELEMQNDALQQARNDLEESRDRYMDLYELAPVGYLTLTDKGSIAAINLTGAALLGEERGKLLQRSFARFVTAEDSDLWHTHLASVLKAEDKLDCELAVQRAGGVRFHVRLDSRRLVKDGQAPTVRVVLTDITGRKQAEAAQQKLDQRLRDQQFYTRSLIEANTDALITCDPSGIINDINKQMESLTGCTRDELIGTPFKNCFTDPERAGAALDLVLSEKKLTNYELTARASGGGETVVSYNAATLFNRDGKLQGVFAALRDITEPKRLEQALQDKNAELESARLVAEKANLAKSDFLSSMSHELRTPLSAILGFAQLVESGTPPPTPTQKRSIDQILKAGWYLLELINEILDLALIESGKLSLSLEPVSLAEVMHECQAMIEPQAQKRGISVTFPRFATPAVVKADRTRVKQVLINLLSNAIKYNKLGGTVVVDCLASTPGRIRICVEDSGNGLAPEKLTQLFQPFNRLGQEANSEEGTGIGLVVCKRLIEWMGGIIGVESTVGKGCVFWIEMNLTVAPQAVAHAAEPAALVQVQNPADAQLFTLLYVEDNPANLMLVEDLLARRPDIRLLSARDGNRGVEMARASLPDVILMDINLPGISGIRALGILAEDPATAHIPVIALSANAMPRDIEKGLEAGFFRYLTKPIRVNEFMTTLNVALKFAKTQATVEARRG